MSIRLLTAFSKYMFLIYTYLACTFYRQRLNLKPVAFFFESISFTLQILDDTKLVRPFLFVSVMVAQMVAVNRALCLFYRNPPAGTKPLSYAKIALKVKNKDGDNPTTGGVRDSILASNSTEKKAPGRAAGLT